MPILAVAVAVGCGGQQPTTPSQPKENVGAPPSPVVRPSRDPVVPVAQGPKVELGDSEQRPVLFFDLRAGMVVRVSGIKYDKLGWVDSYEAGVQPDKGEGEKVLVRTETPAGGGKPPTHTATINSKPVPRQGDKKLVGLSVKDAAGAVLARSAGQVQVNVQTKLSYDSTGRQQIAQQDFQHEGKNYTITYSDYRRDALGRLEGYTAQVVKAE